MMWQSKAFQNADTIASVCCLGPLGAPSLEVAGRRGQPSRAANRLSRLMTTLRSSPTYGRRRAIRLKYALPLPATVDSRPIFKWQSPLHSSRRTRDLLLLAVAAAPGRPHTIDPTLSTRKLLIGNKCFLRRVYSGVPGRTRLVGAGKTPMLLVPHRERIFPGVVPILCSIKSNANRNTSASRRRYRIRLTETIPCAASMAAISHPLKHFLGYKGSHHVPHPFLPVSVSIRLVLTQKFARGKRWLLR